jgi:hypothetical protein
MPVIGAEAGILNRPPSELGHDDNRQIVDPIEEIGVQGAEALSQVGQQPGHQTFAPTLAEMRIPSADIDGGRLQADVRPDERCHLAQSHAEVAFRIVRLRARLVTRRL